MQTQEPFAQGLSEGAATSLVNRVYAPVAGGWYSVQICGHVHPMSVPVKSSCSNKARLSIGHVKQRHPLNDPHLWG